MALLFWGSLQCPLVELIRLAWSALYISHQLHTEYKDQRPFFLFFCFSDPHRGGGFAEELPYQPDRFGNQLKGYPGVTPIVYDPNQVIVPPFLPDTPETRAEIAQYYQSISRLHAGVGELMDYLKESGQFDNTLIVYISDNGMAFPGAKTTLYEAGMQLPCIIKGPRQNTARTWS